MIQRGPQSSYGPRSRSVDCDSLVYKTESLERGAPHWTFHNSLIINEYLNNMSPKVLFVYTSANKTLTGAPTGWYLPEAAHPYYGQSYTTLLWENADFVSIA